MADGPGVLAEADIAAMVPPMAENGGAPAAKASEVQEFLLPQEVGSAAVPSAGVERDEVMPPPPPRQPVKVMAGAVREKAEERMGPRVEKIRQASNVVMDEAAEDPEVRFLLVAALIFVFFVVIFIITNIIK
ncbi:MAG: hypothetical protein WKF30_08165 [Pyrinomonadaceae bacterium]